MSPKPVEIKNYTLGFRVTSEMLDDSSFMEVQNYIDESRTALANALVDDIWGDIAGKPKSKPLTRLQRFKKWLGGKVWNLALKLDPDLLGDYY